MIGGQRISLAGRLAALFLINRIIIRGEGAPAGAFRGVVAPRIVRHGGKIRSAINNAQRALELI